MNQDDVPGAGEEQAAASKAFDLEKQKALSLQSLPPRGRESPAFKQFYKSKLCDDFLCAALDHVAALLRVDDMALARTAGKKPQDIPPPSSEEKIAASLLDQTVKEVSTYYCYTIIQFSRYQAAQQDRMFFESLYEFITNIVVAAFPAQHRFRIEDEVARVVRTDTFNLTRRKNDANHHTKMNFSSRELYVLRYAGDGFMGRRILAALHPRRHAGDSVNQAVARRSPLAAMLVPSAKEISEKTSAAMRDAAASRAVSRAMSRTPTKNKPGAEKVGFHRLSSHQSSPRRPAHLTGGRQSGGGGGGEGSQESPTVTPGRGGERAKSSMGKMSSREQPRSSSALGGYAAGHFRQQGGSLPPMDPRHAQGSGSPRQTKGGGYFLNEKSPVQRGPTRKVPFATG